MKVTVSYNKRGIGTSVSRLGPESKELIHDGQTTHFPDQPKVDPFFKGSDNNDQLIKIAKVMGTDDLQTYVKKYKINIPAPIAKILKSYPAMDLEEFINKNN